MGEYADMAMLEGIDDYWGSDYTSWGWKRASYKKCRVCGQGELVWSLAPPYVLREYSDEAREFVRHNCRMRFK